MTYLLYNLALWLTTPLLLLWVAYRALRGRLPGISQRLGALPPKSSSLGDHVFWIHAVSVGEVKAAAPLMHELKKRIPDARIVMTSSTRTGWNAARELVPPADLVLYPPWDWKWICRRFLRRLKPRAVLILETELWPNLFRECKRFGATLILANGRISDRAFERYHRSRFLWRAVLSHPDTLFVQSTADAVRFKALGAPPDKVRVAGNLKFAAPPSPSPFAEAMQEMSKGSAIEPIIVAGSTMPGEEGFLLEAFQQLASEFPRLWMILAPRHPERCPAVMEQAESLGIAVQLRSQWKAEAPPALPGILILDSMGELGALYRIATVAYVGGTLVPTGGHNILEPACLARPIVIGPSMNNFQEIAEEFLQDCGLGQAIGSHIRIGAVAQISDASALASTLRFLLQDSAFRQRLGKAARRRWERNGSGVSPILDELQRLLAPDGAVRESTVATQRAAVSAGKI